MAKQKNERIITPKGIAVFPWINRPDTKFDPDGKFSVKLRLDPNDPAVAALIEKLDAAAAEKHKAVQDTLKTPKAKKELGLSLPYEADLDEEGNETGMILLYASQKAKIKTDNGVIAMKVAIVDTKGQELKKAPSIYGGSTLKLCVQLNPYSAQGKAGVSLRLVGVQVIDLVSGSGGNLGFGAEEGSFDASAGDDFSGSEEGAEGAETGTEGDF